jgi:hypothetical protein
VTGVLISYLNTERVPTLTEEKYTLNPGGSYTTNYVSQPQYSSFIHGHESEIKSMHEYQDAILALHSDDRVARQLDTLVGTSEWAIRRTSFDYVTRFLVSQLSLHPFRNVFDESTFETDYADFERYIYSDKIEFQVLSPLENFSCDEQQINLEERLNIRRVSSEEIEDFMKSSYDLRFSGLPSLKYVVEHKLEARKIVGNSRNAPTFNWPDLIIKTVTVLRLFKSGAIGTNLMQATPESPARGFLGVGSIRYPIGTTRFWGPPYTLEPTEVERFREFWHQVRELDFEHNAPLNVAIRRFEYAYERTKLEDRLVDYMVAFEALFFKRHEVGEFRHKLSVRVARLLGSTYVERERIADRIRDFYDKRSAVVHGEEVKLDDAFVHEVEDNLRESIKLFVRHVQFQVHEQIINRLDLE